jgi:hypothetical protein
MTDWPGDDRPSGILAAQRRFSVEKFVAWTAALAIGAGAGYAGYTMLQDDEGDPEPTPSGDTEADSEGGTTGAAEPNEPPEPAASPRLDLGGPMRLDIPDPWWVDPSQAPSDEPGPEIEVPNW